MIAYLENYFNLKKSFVFYGSYHHNWMNQMVHVIFVPAIFTTSMSFIAHIPITDKINLSHIVAAFYAISFLKMEPVAGALYAPVVGAMEYLGSRVLINYFPASLALNLFGWAAQIISHKWLEHRQPAFTEDPFQAIHAAVFFVWLELLFFLGYRPSEKEELEKLVQQRIARMNAEEAANMEKNSAPDVATKNTK
ncbi:2-hydroxy-palmitic acid dioxygenase Mpo1-like [Lotmaria passim]